MEKNNGKVEVSKQGIANLLQIFYRGNNMLNKDGINAVSIVWCPICNEVQKVVSKDGNELIRENMFTPEHIEDHSEYFLSHEFGGICEDTSDMVKTLMFIESLLENGEYAYEISTIVDIVKSRY